MKTNNIPKNGENLLKPKTGGNINIGAKLLNDNNSTITDILGETIFNGKEIITVETNNGEIKGFDLDNNIIDLNVGGFI